jgi:hypothetical protein
LHTVQRKYSEAEEALTALRRAEDAQNGGVEAQNGAVEDLQTSSRRFASLDEELDQGIRINEKSRIRIHIKEKSRIRIRLKEKGRIRIGIKEKSLIVGSGSASM